MQTWLGNPTHVLFPDNSLFSYPYHSKEIRDSAGICVSAAYAVGGDNQCDAVIAALNELDTICARYMPDMCPRLDLLKQDTLSIKAGSLERYPMGYSTEEVLIGILVDGHAVVSLATRLNALKSQEQRPNDPLSGLIGLLDDGEHVKAQELETEDPTLIDLRLDVWGDGK